jgi:hypothetical protein
MSPPARISHRLLIERRGSRGHWEVGNDEAMRFPVAASDTLRPDEGAENLGRSCAGRLGDAGRRVERASGLLGQSLGRVFYRRS